MPSNQHCHRVCLRCRAKAPKRGCVHCPTCLPLAGADRFRRRGPYANEGSPTRPASCPTSYRPGSEGKVRELAARLERGERLFHPDDARQE